MEIHEIGVGPVDVIGIKTQLGSGLPVHVDLRVDLELAELCQSKSKSISGGAVRIYVRTYVF